MRFLIWKSSTQSSENTQTFLTPQYPNSFSGKGTSRPNFVVLRSCPPSFRFFYTFTMTNWLISLTSKLKVLLQPIFRKQRKSQTGGVIARYLSIFWQQSIIELASRWQEHRKRMDQKCSLSNHILTDNLATNRPSI